MAKELKLEDATGGHVRIFIYYNDGAAASRCPDAGWFFREADTDETLGSDDDMRVDTAEAFGPVDTEAQAEQDARDLFAQLGYGEDSKDTKAAFDRLTGKTPGSRNL